MADYPDAIYSPRTKNNKYGVVYEPLKDTVLFAEDVTKLDAEVVAIENTLGENPEGAFADVNARLVDIESQLGGGASLWTLIAGTRINNTSFSLVGDVTPLHTTGMIYTWKESGVSKVAMCKNSTYGAPNTTVNLVGDVMASIDVDTLKYFHVSADVVRFALAGTIGATGTDIMRAWYADKAYRVIAAKPSVGTAGTTNNTTFDINKAGSTMFTTKPTCATTVAYGDLFTADSGVSLAINDKVTVDVDAVQSTPAVDGYIDFFVFPSFYLQFA